MDITKPKHKLYDHPYLGGLVAIILTFLLLQTFGGLPEGVAKILQQERPDLGLSADFIETMQHISNILSIAIAFLCLLIHRLWFRKDGYKGCFTRPGLSKREAWLFVIGALLMDVVLVAVNAVVTGTVPMLPTVSTVLLSLQAGISEETIFRAIPVSIMMKNSPNRKRMWIAALITAAVFGAVHMGNLTAGAAFAGSVVQSLNAACIGLLLFAIYLRSGNILLTMVLHTVHDIIGMTDASQASGVVTQVSYSALDLTILAAVAAVYAAAAIYMLRKSKWGEIQATWANIWAE